MRRHRHQQTEPGITLLPFMAVLICTMGTLIVVLMVVVRQAKVRANTVAENRRAAHATATVERQAELEQRRLDREAFQWRYDQLRDSREKSVAELADHRRQLAHLEDHSRRLEDEWNRLAQENEIIENLSQSQRLDQEKAAAELAASQGRLAQQRAELEAARKEAAEKPRSYALIPYDGPNGTNRRPIYIECCRDRVILQPEGIVFEGADFREPLGPGNALAASLRAVREYWNRTGGATGGGDAYPLLIVRPGGADAYLACREAMQSWDDEFGYELVSDDLRLAFPPADPALAELVGRTVADARQQQNAVLLATLARPGVSGPRPYLRATSSGGGFVVEKEPGGGGAGGFGSGEADDSAGQPYSTSARGNAGLADRRPGGAGGAANREAAGSYPDGSPEGQAHQTSASRGSSGPAAGSPPPGSGGFYGGSGGPPAASPGELAGGSPGGQPGSREGSSSPEGQGQSQPGLAAAPPGTSTAHGRQSTDNQQYFGGTETGEGGSGAQPSACLADSRGRDWALPHAARGATGVTRPIRIVCTADQLTIVPQRGSGQALKTVALRESTLDAVDQFVSKLWQHIEEWQMAGPGLFWKPELIVEVAPGGRERFAQLAQLLEGSGITVTQTTR